MAPLLPFAAALFAAALVTASAAGADPGDCGQPRSLGSAPTAADALEILRTGVGQSDCGGYDACTCDVDASGKVLASDALRVLKAAVGQPQMLGCPCMFPTPQTSELFVMTKRQGSFATADLAGNWGLASMISGAGSPLWSRGSIAVQTNGNFSGSSTDSLGSTDDLSGRLALSSNGSLTCTQNCGPSLLGSLDPDKTVAPVTDTPDDGTAQLMLVVKRAASYSTSNLAGTWWMSLLTSQPNAPHWMRGSLTIQNDGNYAGTLRSSDGWSQDVSGRLSLSGNGSLACSGGDCLPSLGGTLDGGKTAAVMTQSSAGAAELLLLVKRGASYSQADLAGNWYASSLATGSDEPFWSRGALAIAADGTISGSLVDNSGSTRQPGGTMRISSEGLVSVPDRPDLRCALDAGKTLLVCTDSWR